MTVTEINPGEIFTVRVYKAYVGYAWANSYEVRADADFVSPYDALATLADRFATLERNLHNEGVLVDRVVISTYQPDGEPYNPESFAVFPISLPAVAPISSEVAPLELCVYVRRNVQAGRFGRLFYRGCLTENSLVSPAYRPQVTDAHRNALQSVINLWYGTGGPGVGWTMVLARGRPDPFEVRDVTNLIVEQRVVTKQIRNRYFDIP